MTQQVSLRNAFVFVALGMLLALGLQGWSMEPPKSAAQAKGPQSAEEKIRKLKLELPAVTKPANTYVAAVRVGDLLFVSGMVPWPVAGKAVVGRLGQDFDVPRGQASARQVGLQMLSVVKAELGSLDKVARLVKTMGMVNATPDFTQQPQVINGFSDLMVEVFGEEAGKGTRSAVGMASLPGGSPVEIEAIFQVRK